MFISTDILPLSLSLWIYVIYSILYKLIVSTISFMPVKNYHTVAPSMCSITLKRCSEFVMFSARFSSITVTISSDLGIYVFFFDSRDLLEINPCVVDKVCLVKAYATALVPIMLASPKKWSSVSLFFSWTRSW